MRHLLTNFVAPQLILRDDVTHYMFCPFHLRQFFSAVILTFLFVCLQFVCGILWKMQMQFWGIHFPNSYLAIPFDLIDLDGC